MFMNLLDFKFYTLFTYCHNSIKFAKVMEIQLGELMGVFPCHFMKYFIKSNLFLCTLFKLLKSKLLKVYLFNVSPEL